MCYYIGGYSYYHCVTLRNDELTRQIPETRACLSLVDELLTKDKQALMYLSSFGLLLRVVFDGN